jgi:aryl-alcohol dehydrogenase-like predicted oxidoreductase
VAETLRIGGDLDVSRLGFGAMRLCGPRILGWPRDRANALAVLRRAVELGVTLIDTSDAYGPEVSELQIADALHPYPEGVVIATKGGLLRTRSGSWPSDARPEHLREACEASLRRLRLERIDLYQLHAPDPRVPLEESLGALAELRREGKIRHVGVSNVSVDELARARAIVPVVSVQNRFSVGDRAEEPVLEACERLGLAFLPWRPLETARAYSSARRVAGRLGATPAQVALAWLLARSPVIAPIPGTSSLEHLEENVATLDVRLTAAELDELGG